MSVVIDNGKEDGAKGKTILDALDEARIFNVEKADDGRIIFEESCDRYFSAKLTKAQVLALADELRALVDA